MSDAGDPKLSKDEFLKEGSRQLRGTIARELTDASDCFIEDNAKLLKVHGTYQQDDKDHRKDKNADGTAQRQGVHVHGPHPHPGRKSDGQTIPGRA